MHLPNFLSRKTVINKQIHDLLKHISYLQTNNTKIVFKRIITSYYQKRSCTKGNLHILLTATHTTEVLISHYVAALKKWKSTPSLMRLQRAPIVSTTLSPIPRLPRTQFRYQDAFFFLDFVTDIHMKEGYASVIGSAIPPMRAPRLDKKGNATAIRKAIPENKIRYPLRRHFGHGLLCLSTYPASIWSNTGIA